MYECIKCHFTDFKLQSKEFLINNSQFIINKITGNSEYKLSLTF